MIWFSTMCACAYISVNFDSEYIRLGKSMARRRLRCFITNCLNAEKCKYNYLYTKWQRRQSTAIVAMYTYFLFLRLLLCAHIADNFFSFFLLLFSFKFVLKPNEIILSICCWFFFLCARTILTLQLQMQLNISRFD